MTERIHIALPKGTKKLLEDLARKMAIKEKRFITTGDVIRRAIMKAYKIGPEKEKTISR